MSFYERRVRVGRVDAAKDYVPVELFSETFYGRMDIFPRDISALGHQFPNGHFPAWILHAPDISPPWSKDNLEKTL